MSSLWTPDGERPVGRPSRPSPPDAGSGGGPDRGGRPDHPNRPSGETVDGPPDEPTDEDLARLQEQLAQTPAEVVVANHAFGLFELAALHLSIQPPQLAQARLAIDAIGALVEGLHGRLGDAEPTLTEGLAQLRLAFVQIQASAEA